MKLKLIKGGDKMNTKLLENILTKEQREIGLSLDEMDDHFIAVRFKGNIARDFLTGNPLIFNATKVTVETLQHETDQQLEWSRSGITFERRIE
jgi:hypothetical protein